MQILTDILSLFKRNQFVEKVNDYDAIVVGVNEAPQLTGIASPIPYKNVKLIRIKDFVNLASPQIINIPADASEAGCYSGETTDPITEEVTNNFRRLKSLSLDLTIEENGDYIEYRFDSDMNIESS